MKSSITKSTPLLLLTCFTIIILCLFFNSSPDNEKLNLNERNYDNNLKQPDSRNGQEIEHEKSNNQESSSSNNSNQDSSSKILKNFPDTKYVAEKFQKLLKKYRSENLIVPEVRQPLNETQMAMQSHKDRNRITGIDKLLFKDTDSIKYLSSGKNDRYDGNEYRLDANTALYSYNKTCRSHTCSLPCNNTDSIGIYLYPLSNTETYSREFLELYYSILHSEFYVEKPSSACYFLPNIDFIIPTIQKVSRLQKLEHFSRFYNFKGLLPGSNHILFTEFSQTLSSYPIGNSIIVAPDFTFGNFRVHYDLSISTLNVINSPSSSSNSVPIPVPNSKNICNCNNINEVISSLQNSCVPNLTFEMDESILPYNDLIDFDSFSLRHYSLKTQTDKQTINTDQISILQKRGENIYNYYFKSINRIVLSALGQLNERAFPHKRRSYFEWNNIAHIQKDSKSVPYRERSPIFATQIAQDLGYTCVILAYDRIESLFKVIKQVSLSDSLKKIIIVWNNQNLEPPKEHEWPVSGKNVPLVVIQTKKNVLSNRFHPFVEIETECVLSIDDDIVMLTKDELDFGYHTWREYPDRIVGFPSRLHLENPDSNGEDGKDGKNDNKDKYKYESEWKNEYSMVLTGVAFYHNYFNYLYTFQTPKPAIKFVDDAMNCEDILMNFVASNATHKAPIKVSPRKKFKCTDCSPGLSGGISVEPSHMVERSACINKFSEIYGYMPLKTINFRADPLLYKDDFDKKQMRFSDMGEL